MQRQSALRNPPAKPCDPGRLERAKVAYLTVQGLGDEHCATRIQRGLLALRSVVLADVFLDKGLAAVVYDPAHLLPKTLLQAVHRAGQEACHGYTAKILMISNVPSTHDQAPEGSSWTLPDSTQNPVVHGRNVQFRS